MYFRARTPEYGYKWYHTDFDTIDLMDYDYLGDHQQADLRHRVAVRHDRGRAAIRPERTGGRARRRRRRRGTQGRRRGRGRRSIALEASDRHVQTKRADAYQARAASIPARRTSRQRTSLLDQRREAAEQGVHGARRVGHHRLPARAGAVRHRAARCRARRADRRPGGRRRGDQRPRGRRASRSTPCRSATRTTRCSWRCTRPAIRRPVLGRPGSPVAVPRRGAGARQGDGRRLRRRQDEPHGDAATPRSTELDARLAAMTKALQPVNAVLPAIR